MKNKDIALWSFLVDSLAEYAAKFDLKLKEVKGPKKKWRGRYVASCSKRGVIRMRLRCSEETPYPGKRYEAYHYIDTMAHELAHLRHQKHSSEWFELYFQILDLMRVCGVYRDLRELLGKKNV